MEMNLDAYYRGLASQQLQELGDRLIGLSREAEQAGAHEAAFRLADLSTQLLDLGVDASGQQTPDPRPPA
ncbi:MAG TPA: hypothetical protein VIK95_05665 [Egibacteraceae bacterium]